MRSILFILPSLAVGGAEANTVKLSNFLVKNGHTVDILLLQSDQSLAYLLNPHVRVTSLGFTKYSKSFIKLAWFIRRANPSAIIANMWPITCLVFSALIFSPWLFQRLIIVEHIDLKKGLQLSSFLEQFLEFIFHSIAPYFLKAVVGVSPGVLDSLKKPFCTNLLNFHYIPNPIYTEFSVDFLDIEYSNYSCTPKPIKALAVGNFKPQKDYYLMIDSIYSLYTKGVSVQLSIAGMGPLLPSVMAYARSLMPSYVVNFLGLVDPYDVIKLYRTSDIYLLTSAWEGFSNSLAEALVEGCRCVAINCPSGPSVVLDNGTFGTLVENRDAAVFASAIISELSIHRSSHLLKSHLTQFSVENVGQKYLDLILL